MSGLFDRLLGDAASGGSFMSRLLEDQPLSAAPAAPQGALLGDSVMGHAIGGALYGVAGARRSPDFLSGFAAGLRSGARVEAQHRQRTSQIDRMQRDQEQREQARLDQVAKLPPPAGVEPQLWEAYKAADPEGAVRFFLDSLRRASSLQDSPATQPPATTAADALPADAAIAEIDGADGRAAPAGGTHPTEPDDIARVKPR
jgi:hypothetical protein